MNEERRQGYLNLISALLICSSSDGLIGLDFPEGFLVSRSSDLETTSVAGDSGCGIIPVSSLK